MAEEQKGFLDELADAFKDLAKDTGLSDLVDKLKVKDGIPEKTKETISQKEYDELRQAYVRLEQEVEKYKTRLCREHEQAVYHAESNVLESAFKALDALEGAVQSLEKMDLSPELRAKIAEGFTMQRDAVLDYLDRNYTVRPISSVGVQADPQYHKVLSEVPSGEVKGVIVYMVKVGYTRNGQVIREAEVVVAR